MSELYDRIGFAAVGKYNEFENLRRGGILQADLRGYQYGRRDVTGRALANAYAQALGSIFTDQLKPYEVEICVAEVAYQEQDSNAVLYRITFDGSIVDEREYVVMGGTTEPIVTALKASYEPGLDLASAIGVAVKALQAGTPEGDKDKRVLGVSSSRSPRSSRHDLAGPSGGSGPRCWSGCSIPRPPVRAPKPRPRPRRRPRARATAERSNSS